MTVGSRALDRVWCFCLLKTIEWGSVSGCVAGSFVKELPCSCSKSSLRGECLLLFLLMGTAFVCLFIS